MTGLTRGQVGKTVTTDVRYTRTPASPGRNVVAILPGSDPKLRGEYVAIGGHSDHIGFGPMTVQREHDSLRIYNAVGRPAGAEGGRDLRAKPITPEEWAEDQFGYRGPAQDLSAAPRLDLEWRRR